MIKLAKNNRTCYFQQVFYYNRFMFNISNRLIKQVTMILYVANIQFWLFLLIYFISFETITSVSDYFECFVFGSEIIVFSLSFYGYIKQKKIIYIGSLIFVFLNAILSITDQIGSLDLISLVLNVSLFLSLLAQYKRLYKSHN